MSASGDVFTFRPRPPPPRMIQSNPTMRSSIYRGIPGGSANGVTPPTCIPVSAIISSAEANDAFETPINFVTRLFTSRRVCASTTQATNFFEIGKHTSELQSRQYLVCRLLLEKKKKNSRI